MTGHSPVECPPSPLPRPLALLSLCDECSALCVLCHPPVLSGYVGSETGTPNSRRGGPGRATSPSTGTPSPRDHVDDDDDDDDDPHGPGCPCPTGVLACLWSGSVGSETGTPNSRRGGPGYLAEHWDALTTALERAASKTPISPNPNPSSTSSSLASTLERSHSQDLGASGGTGGSGVMVGGSQSHGGVRVAVGGSSSHAHGGVQGQRRASFSEGEDSGMEDNNANKNPEKKKRFAEKRNKHYGGEFQRMKVR
jgi:hypothetical protein